jgi:hypothetical protein
MGGLRHSPGITRDAGGAAYAGSAESVVEGGHGAVWDEPEIEGSSSLNFALIGVAGHIAARHLRAIRDTHSHLIAATDPRDAVGVLDQFGYDVRFFTEIERFERHLHKLKRSANGMPADYVSICTPNYLHDAHSRLGMQVRAQVICEKPLVIDHWNLDPLEELESDSRLDELQAAILRVKLRHLAHWTRRRRQIAERYSHELRDVGISLPVEAADRTHVYHRYVAGLEGRDDIQKALAARGIASEIYYPQALHLAPALQHLAVRRETFPFRRPLVGRCWRCRCTLNLVKRRSSESALRLEPRRGLSLSDGSFRSRLPWRRAHKRRGQTEPQLAERGA